MLSNVARAWKGLGNGNVFHVVVYGSLGFVASQMVYRLYKYVFFLQASRPEKKFPITYKALFAVKHLCIHGVALTSELVYAVREPRLIYRILKEYARNYRNINIPYANRSHKNYLDVYFPNPKGETLKPVFIFIHGGAWSFGHKWQYSLIGKTLANDSIVSVMANYRLFPLGDVTSMVQDVEDVVKWTVQNIHKYGGDKNRIFLSGHSAGAHIGALYLVKRSMRRRDANSPLTHGDDEDISVKGFIGLSGPYDIADHYQFESQRRFSRINVHKLSPMHPSMKGTSNFHAHSPTAIVRMYGVDNGHLPAMYLVHGKNDIIVPFEASQKFVEELKKREAKTELKLFDQADHIDTVVGLMSAPTRVDDELIAYIKKIIHE